MKSFVVLLALLAACSPTPETRDAIKQAVSETQTKPRIVIQIRLIAPGMPTEKDLELRSEIEKQIEQQNMGAVVAQEAGDGHMDITVEVDNTNEAIPRIKDLLREAGVAERSTVRVVETQD